MFIKWRKKCLVLVTVSVAQSISATPACTTTPTAPDWNMVYHSNTVSLYEPTHLAGPPELIASLRWHSLPEPLYRIIWNYAQFQQNIPGVRKSEVLLTEGGHKWVYQQLELPGPLKDRHYILESRNTDSLPDQHYYRVSWKLSQRFPLPEGNLVSPSVFSGCWNIQTASKDGLIAQYRIQLDPAGNVPRWITQRGMRRYVKTLVEQLHRQLSVQGDSTHRHSE